MWPRARHRKLRLPLPLEVAPLRVCLFDLSVHTEGGGAGREPEEGAEFLQEAVVKNTDSPAFPTA